VHQSKVMLHRVVDADEVHRNQIGRLELARWKT
jgi:hypothetical protein